ncbi:unnamed protein product, partial [Prorocentrum cordatum]
AIPSSTSRSTGTTQDPRYDASSDQCRWFWEIVLDSFDEDDQRRELLTFVTGSDRAPPK